MFIDTHAHLNFKAFAENWREVLDRAVENGVEKIIVVGTDVPTSRRALDMASEHAALYAAVGIHPHHAKKYLQAEDTLEEDLEVILALATHPKTVAVGEIGLDKHDYKNTKYELSGQLDEQEKLWQSQLTLLRRQIEMARSRAKPVILHSRDLHDEVLNEVKESGVRGVFHCYEGSRKYARRIVEAGFYISFTGNITFIADRSSVAADVPLDRLLIETDSPYMTPHPLRGVQNEPKNVQLIAEHHALSRGIPLETVAEVTTRNARQLFGLA